MKRFEFDHEDRKHLIAEGLRCPICANTIYQRGTIDALHGQVRYHMFGCLTGGHNLALRIDTLDGHAKIHFYALPNDVTCDWFYEHIEESAPTPITAPEPVVTRESEAERRKLQMQADQTANALEAHRKIADLVLSRQRKGLSFIDRNRVIGRLSVLRGRKVWAVDPSHPAIAEVINDHGGKPVIGRIWDEHKLIVVGERRNGRGQITKLRTQDVSLGVGEPVYCYLFLAKPFEDARKGTLQIGSMFS